MLGVPVATVTPPFSLAYHGIHWPVVTFPTHLFTSSLHQAHHHHYGRSGAQLRHLHRHLRTQWQEHLDQQVHRGLTACPLGVPEP